ncbi:eclosion hormone [Eurosta solidaginis]|uniref:eclosion hormone n=1 Tax=Eurosta solidaginis TaxID=178769 RepID=UPI00353161CD
MFTSNKSIFLIALLSIVAIFVLCPAVDAMPSIRKRFDTLAGIDFIQICLNNCAQCKEMFGDFFQGQTCAESCLKFKGKSIPDCEDVGSITPFLNHLG